MAEWEKWDLVWVDSNDSRVCPGCKENSKLKPRPYSQWHTYPGAGDTECEDRCRCILLPESLYDAIPTFEGKASIDTMDYREILDATPELLENSKIYEAVSRYETVTDDWNLPDWFYSETRNIKQKLDDLESLIDRISSGRITAFDKSEILKRNPWMGGVIPGE